MRKTTTYDQLMRILGDGDWHSADELTAVAHFPQYWIDELRHEGHQVVTDEVGHPVIRLRNREAATAGC
jgi:hypothetical protein